MIEADENARAKEIELRRVEERLWVAQAQAGDMEAFGQLVKRFEQPLLYFLRRMISDEPKAWDTYQEVWIDVWRGLGKLVAPGAFRVWVYRIANAKAARCVAREVKERTIVEKIEDGREFVAEEANDFKAEAVHAALGKLSTEMRAALTLFYLEEMSLEEIAAALDCPVGTVKSRLHNGRRELRGIITKENL